ncbi:MAG TPA: hypothetical protein VN517_12230 [Terriglobales bacterium]|nr:hypothetical protein [Terriglobales bacterium]
MPYRREDAVSALRVRHSGRFAVIDGLRDILQQDCAQGAAAAVGVGLAAGVVTLPLFFPFGKTQL